MSKVAVISLLVAVFMLHINKVAHGLVLEHLTLEQMVCVPLQPRVPRGANTRGV